MSRVLHRSPVQAIDPRSNVCSTRGVKPADKTIDARVLRAAFRPATERIVGHTIDQVWPVHPLLAPLLPWPGLRYGSTIILEPTIGATSLLYALIAPASSYTASWAAVGQPALGMLAAADMGINLQQMAAVPDPGPDPLAVVDALAAGFSIVSWTPRQRVDQRSARRLVTRTRRHGTVLIIHGAEWPLADIRLRTQPLRVGGLGHGRGRLRWRELAIEATTRSRPTPRRVVVQLPDEHGSLSAATDVDDARPASSAAV